MKLCLNDEYILLLELLSNNCSKTDECDYCDCRVLCDNICGSNSPIEELEELSNYGI